MLKDRLAEDYRNIWNDCAITSASCDRYAPLLIGMLHSLKMNFPNHPMIYIADLGMNLNQKKEISQMKNVNIFQIKKFLAGGGNAIHGNFILCYSLKKNPIFCI